MSDEKQAGAAPEKKEGLLEILDRVSGEMAKEAFRLRHGLPPGWVDPKGEERRKPRARPPVRPQADR